MALRQITYCDLLSHSTHRRLASLDLGSLPTNALNIDSFASITQFSFFLHCHCLLSLWSTPSPLPLLAMSARTWSCNKQTEWDKFLLLWSLVGAHLSSLNWFSCECVFSVVVSNHQCVIIHPDLASANLQHARVWILESNYHIMSFFCYFMLSHFHCHMSTHMKVIYVLWSFCIFDITCAHKS